MGRERLTLLRYGVAVTARASRRALLGTATLGLLGVAGCGVPTVAPDAAADLPRRVVAAWEAGDRTGFVAALGGDAVRAAALWDAWRALGTVRVVAAAAGVRVHWRVAGERRESVDTLVVRGSPQPRLAPSAGPRPPWFDHRLEVVTDGAVALLATPGLDAAARAGWLSAASEALERLRDAPLAPWRPSWDGMLVLVAPADALHFARTTGLVEGLGATAAVTLQPWPDAPARVVVNPDALRLAGAERVGLLVHEGVHAITGSAARWDAPQWLAEGLAESVACAGDTARTRRNLLLARRGGGVPTIDPGREPDEAAYARAQLAFEACVERWGRDAVNSWLVAWDASAHPEVADLEDVAGSALTLTGRRGAR